MRKTVTQKDIAKECGVTTACVGYILSGTSKYKFKKETVELVRETAAKLHYRPNLQAANLRRKENKLIICIVGSCCRYSDTLHIQMLEEEVAKYGYQLLVHFIMGLPDAKKICFLKNVINLPAGILIWSLGIHDPEKKQELLLLLKKAPPTVHMSHAMPGSGVDYIRILWSGGSLPCLIQFFHKKQFKKIGYCLSYEEYQRGLCSEFEHLAIQAGMQPEFYYTDKSIRPMNFFEVGRQIAQKLLIMKRLPDALYCVSDEMTFSIIETLRQKGISVPQDLFIVSGGDSEFLKNITDPPPYLIHDIPLLVSTAVKDLIGRIERGDPLSGTERCIGTIEQRLFFPPKPSINYSGVKR